MIKSTAWSSNLRMGSQKDLCTQGPNIILFLGKKNNSNYHCEISQNCEDTWMGGGNWLDAYS